MWYLVTHNTTKELCDVTWSRETWLWARKDFGGGMTRDPRGVLTQWLIKWKRTLSYLEKALDDAYQDVLKKIDSIWAIKGLIMTRSNLVAIVLERLDLKSIIVGSPMVVVFCLLVAIDFSVYQYIYIHGDWYTGVDLKKLHEIPSIRT